MSRRPRFEPAQQCLFGRLLGFLFAALSLTLPLQAQSLLAAAPPEPVNHTRRRYNADETSATVADLLHLIKQLDPLRVTLLHIDYFDHALATQTEYHRRRRRAGFGRRGGRKRSYDASKD